MDDGSGGDVDDDGGDDCIAVIVIVTMMLMVFYYVNIYVGRCPLNDSIVDYDTNCGFLGLPASLSCLRTVYFATHFGYRRNDILAAAILR